MCGPVDHRASRGRGGRRRSEIAVCQALGIPYPWNDVDGDKKFDPGETVYNMCPEGTFIPDNNTFCQGTPLILKIGTPSGKPGQPDIASLQQEPGHFSRSISVRGEDDGIDQGGVPGRFHRERRG